MKRKLVKKDSKNKKMFKAVMKFNFLNSANKKPTITCGAFGKPCK